MTHCKLGDMVSAIAVRGKVPPGKMHTTGGTKAHAPRLKQCCQACSRSIPFLLKSVACLRQKLIGEWASSWPDRPTMPRTVVSIPDAIAPVLTAPSPVDRMSSMVTDTACITLVTCPCTRIALDDRFAAR